MELEHGLIAEYDYNNPTILVIKKVGGTATAVITKDNNGRKSLIFISPSSDQIIDYIKVSQAAIESYFKFNETIGDEIGIEKFETCSHRSETEVDSVIPTCCSSVLITAFKCYKRGFPRVVPTICKTCGDYSKK